MEFDIVAALKIEAADPSKTVNWKPEIQCVKEKTSRKFTGLK
jgi:hypothetical protein